MLYIYTYKYVLVQVYVQYMYNTYIHVITVQPWAMYGGEA